MGKENKNNERIINQGFNVIKKSKELYIYDYSFLSYVSFHEL